MLPKTALSRNGKSCFSGFGMGSAFPYYLEEGEEEEFRN
jgi:hypothetical protein